MSSEIPPEYQPHIGASRQYVRDVILGVNRIEFSRASFAQIVGNVATGSTIDWRRHPIRIERFPRPTLLRFATSSISQGAAELFAYGTAVRVD